MTLAWPAGRQLRDALAQSATPAQPCGRAELSHMLMSLHLDVGLCMNDPPSLTPPSPSQDRLRIAPRRARLVGRPWHPVTASTLYYP